MRILVISHTPHYLQDNVLVGWGPTVRELDLLATLFTELVHLAPFHRDPAPASALPYESSNVRFIAVAPAGGRSWPAKLRILTTYPYYLQTIHSALKKTDMVHVRCPANISLLALLYLTFRRQPGKRWVKYAGNWQPDQPDPLAYRLQRWWLRHGWQGGKVTVNGRWPDQPAHVISFNNPSLSDLEIAAAATRTYVKTLAPPLRLLFVGALHPFKGVSDTLRVAAQLKEANIPFHLDILGDGPERSTFQTEGEQLGLATEVSFHGWLPKNELAAFYAGAHFLLLPSRTEGWPKVLSEAMAYGVVPLTSDISAIPQILAESGTGRTHPVGDVASYVTSIMNYLADPPLWQRESHAGPEAAYKFSYNYYLKQVKKLINSMDGAGIA